MKLALRSARSPPPPARRRRAPEAQSRRPSLRPSLNAQGDACVSSPQPPPLRPSAERSRPARSDFPIACEVRQDLRGPELSSTMTRARREEDYRCGSNTYRRTARRRHPDPWTWPPRRGGVDVLAAAPGRRKRSGCARRRDGRLDEDHRQGRPRPTRTAATAWSSITAAAGEDPVPCHLAKGSIMVKVGDQVGLRASRSPRSASRAAPSARICMSPCARTATTMDPGSAEARPLPPATSTVRRPSLLDAVCGCRRWPTRKTRC